MIETKIQELIEAIDANTLALQLLAGKPVETDEKPAKAAKPAKATVISAKEANKIQEKVLASATPPAVTDADVSKAIESLLKANKRAEAIELLKKHGAKSASAINSQGPEVQAAFIAGAEEILLGA